MRHHSKNASQQALTPITRKTTRMVMNGATIVAILMLRKRTRVSWSEEFMSTFREEEMKKFQRQLHLQKEDGDFHPMLAL